MKRVFILFLFVISFSYSIASSNKGSLNWGAGLARYVSYMSITGKTGFITTPSAYCAPMGMLSFGVEQTFSTRSRIGVLANIQKVTFTPHHIFEFGFSKALAFLDVPSPTVYPYGRGVNNGFYFDSTPFFIHAKLRFLDWGRAALAFGQDFDIVPDDSGSDSRGYMSTTIYIVFTGVTTKVGAFSLGFGKTFYLMHIPDVKFNFFAAYVYSFAQLDHRLQLCFDLSNADYRAGASQFRVADEDRAYLNFQLRGVLVKTKRFEWTMMAAFFDLLDIGSIGFNASIGMTFNIDLY
ncbi:MAG: hypothetical protein KAT05_16935 [Spirochaetes bacterium]|nr:hypothetical protein [Spirochaetota bacterium]